MNNYKNEEGNEIQNKRAVVEIGVEGASKISEALKVNTTLIEVDLSCDE